MQVTFKWVSEKTEHSESQYLVMMSKAIKGGGVAIAEVFQSTDGYCAEFIGAVLVGKKGKFFAHAETAIRHAEKRLGIYKAPKKKADKK